MLPVHGPPLFNQNTRCISKNSKRLLATALQALQILLVQAKARSTERAGRDECHRTRRAGRAEKGGIESIAELTWLKMTLLRLPGWALDGLSGFPLCIALLAES
jgi:hypothetical protein